eukprot:6103468-Pyramimonas_sp.AAC.1
MPILYTGKVAWMRTVTFTCIPTLFWNGLISDGNSLNRGPASRYYISGNAPILVRIEYAPS